MAPRWFVPLISWILAPALALAQPGPEAETQHWAGTIQLPGGAAIEAVFTLIPVPPQPDSLDAGAWVGTMDIAPAPGIGGAVAVPLEQIEITPTELRFAMRSPDGSRNLVNATRADGAETAEGSFVVGEATALRLAMKRVSPEAALLLVPRRPQQPRPPYPFRAEDVAFDQGDVSSSIAGTLTLPDGPGPFPALILLSDEGAQGRNFDTELHQPFTVLAASLARSGFAVLRCDDRGVGRSAGDYSSVTTSSLVDDALSMTRFLAGRKDTDRSRIGLIGVGEGATVAALAAAKAADPSIAALILIAPPALPGAELVAARELRAMLGQGEDPDYAAARRDRRLALFRAVAEGADETTLLAMIKADLQAMIDTNRADIVGLNASTINEFASEFYMSSTRPHRREWLGADPLPAYRGIRCPVLVLAGELDTVIPTDDNLPRAEAAIRQSPAKDVTVTRLPGLSHLLQPAVTGSPEEAMQIETTIDPAALDAAASWLRARMMPRQP
ncbi:MAG: alpha/beta hydrolase [Phycisphaeraceae bacterium]|nr:alpha/beta hydrolase [Phycisphaeraceae bacterium]